MNNQFSNQNEPIEVFSDPEHLDGENDEEDMETEFKNLTEQENILKSLNKNSPKKLNYFLNHLDNSEDENNQIKCKICSKFKSHFFCENCIKNGDFTSSKQTEIIKERFAEKKLKFIKLKKNLENIDKSLHNQLDPTIQINRLQHELNYKNENKKILNNNLNENKKEINFLIKELKDTDKKSIKNKSRNKSLVKKLNSLKCDVDAKEKIIEEKKKKLSLINEQIRQASKEKIFQLTEFIFPVTSYNFDENPETGNIYSCESSPLLTFSGESANEEKEEENEKIVIVEPWLPSNGDYSAYSIWATQHKDLVPSSGLIENSIRNSTNRISSALSYTTQLLSLIGFYLDEKFPRKIHFKEFYINTDQNGRKIYLTEEQFAHKVAKLNANIFYFCLQQGVDIRLLSPKKTLKNLQLLTDINPLTIDKYKAFTLSSEAVNLVEKYLGHDLAIFIDDDEFDYNLKGDIERAEDDLNELEWESVPEMPYSSDALTYSNQTSSTYIFSSFVNNIWKAATRR